LELHPRHHRRDSQTQESANNNPSTHRQPSLSCRCRGCLSACLAKEDERAQLA
jgi:hypothetical protein